MPIWNKKQRSNATDGANSLQDHVLKKRPVANDDDATPERDLYAVDAAADAALKLGKSGVIALTITGDDHRVPPTIPVNLVGLNGFYIPVNLVLIPEPSTLALALTGGISLLACRRKK